MATTPSLQEMVSIIKERGPSCIESLPEETLTAELALCVAKIGDLKSLAALIERGCPWDWVDCSCASTGGLEFVKMASMTENFQWSFSNAGDEWRAATWFGRLLTGGPLRKTNGRSFAMVVCKISGDKKEVRERGFAVREYPPEFGAAECVDAYLLKNAAQDSVSLMGRPAPVEKIVFMTTKYIFGGFFEVSPEKDFGSLLTVRCCMCDASIIREKALYTGLGSIRPEEEISTFLHRVVSHVCA